MSGIWVQLTILGLALVSLARAGLRTRGLLGAVLIVQAAYWAFGYVVRPAALAMIEPAPRAGDSIADPRMWGNYTDRLADVMLPATIGLTGYTVAMLVWLRRDGRTSARPRVELRQGHALFLIAAGWLFRFGELGSPDSTLLQTLALLASVGVGALVLLTPRRPTGLALIAVAGSELAWSVLTASKTPFFALALWLFLRFIVDGERLRIKRLVPLAAGALAAFYVVQNVKISNGQLTDFGEADDLYPSWVQPALPLIARFDALNALSDAHFAGPRSWMGAGEALSYAVTALVPRQFVEKSDVVGARWGNEVRVLSRPGTEAGANLAEGPVAEGWVVAGWAGVAVSLLALFVLTIMVARILGSNSIFLAVLGLALTSQPYLFERGALAAAEGIGKGLQVAVVAGLVLAFLRLETAEVAVTRATGRMLDEAPARG